MENLHGCTCKDGSWTAVLDKMPPGAPRLAVVGTCTCPTPGYRVSLEKANPQGFNPEILLLELVTQGPSGMVSQVVTDYERRYVEENAPAYRTVKIQPCNITVPVKVVS